MVHRAAPFEFREPQLFFYVRIQRIPVAPAHTNTPTSSVDYYSMRDAPKTDIESFTEMYNF
ncbi:hypothetical protein GL2_38240 [Microbulbifer sp. GL-2]|nr:hypothetical protein GL2_38240 [Microbulbifer sp. GL-2]